MKDTLHVYFSIYIYNEILVGNIKNKLYTCTSIYKHTMKAFLLTDTLVVSGCVIMHKVI